MNHVSGPNPFIYLLIYIMQTSYNFIQKLWNSNYFVEFEFFTDQNMYKINIYENINLR